MNPKTKPNSIRARYGSDAKTPECPKSNPSTSDINLGPAVNSKYKPHKLPKCKTV